MLETQGFVVDCVEEHAGRRFAAAFLDGVRLIDIRWFNRPTLPTLDAGHGQISGRVHDGENLNHVPADLEYPLVAVAACNF
jgi:hypothetical protein